MRFMQLGMPLAATSLGLAVAGEAGIAGGEIRPPVVAGKFYPESAAALKSAIEKFMKNAVPARVQTPLAIVVPHAGYIYSGQICADGYNQVRDGAYEAVVLLGTNHTAPDLRKIALYPGAGFRTPLGTVPVDEKVVAALIAAGPDCKVDKTPHLREHSIEVQIPFIQILFPQAKIVPAVVGIADVGLSTRFGAALSKALKGRKALVVASSDLSHYPSAADAEAVDRATLAAIASLDPTRLRDTVKAQMSRRIRGLDTCACGEAPIMAAMEAAKALGATGAAVVSYAHSGDVPIGDRERVVGYGAVVFTAGPEKTDKESERSANADDTLSATDKQTLLAFARETISSYLTAQTVPLPRGFGPAAQEARGVFVTLKKRGRLRGCIGRMTPDRPLANLVGAMALQAAFEDPRFAPVTLEELTDLKIEISVLTPMQPVSGPEAVVAGRDGVLLNQRGRSAVFLPQVAPEQGWGRDEMLDHLAMKAGLPAGAWREGAQLSTFQAIVFAE